MQSCASSSILFALRPSTLQTAVRYKSLKYTRRPFARPYKRRMYDELLKPILPTERLSMAERCEMNDRAREQKAGYSSSSLSEIEFGLRDHIRRLLVDFRVMAVCHLQFNGLHEYGIQKRMLRVDGIHQSHYDNRVMAEVVKDTRIGNLAPLFVGQKDTTDVLFARDLATIRPMVRSIDASPHLTLLAIVVDNKIMTAKEARAFAEFEKPEHLPAVTVSLLQKLPQRTSQLLQSSTLTLSQLLAAREEQLKDGKGEEE